MPNTKQTWDQNLRVSLKQDDAVLKGLTIEERPGVAQAEFAQHANYGIRQADVRFRPLDDFQEGQRSRRSSGSF